VLALSALGCQIVAMAKADGTSVIYAIEPHMEAHGKGVGLLDPAYL